MASLSRAKLSPKTRGREEAVKGVHTYIAVLVRLGSFIINVFFSYPLEMTKTFPFEFEMHGFSHRQKQWSTEGQSIWMKAKVFTIWASASEMEVLS